MLIEKVEKEDHVKVQFDFSVVNIILFEQQHFQ